MFIDLSRLKRHASRYANANPVMFEDPTGHFGLVSQLVGMAASKLLDRMATINTMRYFRRVAGGLCKIAKHVVMPYNKFYKTLGKLSPFEKQVNPQANHSRRKAPMPKRDARLLVY